MGPRADEEAVAKRETSHPPNRESNPGRPLHYANEVIVYVKLTSVTAESTKIGKENKWN
jgi:hypothetical protein